MQKFVAKSKQSRKILNTLRMSSHLPINILIVGERGTGKKSLVREVFDDISFFPAKEITRQDRLPKTIGVYDLHEVSDIAKFFEDMQERRVIALSEDFKPAYEEFFPVILELPPLKERPEDYEELKRYYIEEIKNEMGIEELSCDVPNANNAIELKRAILKEAVLSTMDEEEILGLLEKFIDKKLPISYKEWLYIYELPLLRAAKKRYKSALAMSKALGLNRATLTSKLQKYKNKL